MQIKMDQIIHVKANKIKRSSSNILKSSLQFFIVIKSFDFLSESNKQRNRLYATDLVNLEWYGCNYFINYLDLEWVIQKYISPVPGSGVSFAFPLCSQNQFQVKSKQIKAPIPRKGTLRKNLCHCCEKRLLCSCQEGQGKTN